MTKSAIALVVTAAVVVLAVAGNLKKSGSPSDTQAAQVPPPPGFVTHQGSGFALQRPEDWVVSAPSLTEISIASPDGGLAALIRARIVRGDLQSYLAQNYFGSERGIRNARALNVSADGPNVARGMFEFQERNVAKRASVVLVRQGEIATVFAAVAPAEQLAAELPRLTRILEGFRFTAPAAGGGAERDRTRAPTMRYAQWVDPNEQAFSMDLPAGWRPQGGLLRRADGVRVAWVATAPDGAAFLFGGDPTMPSYFVFPTEIALSLGNREGYPTGPGGPIMLRFQDAQAMGQTLLQQRFGQVQVTSAKPRPDMVEMLRRSPVLAGAVSRMSAAELEFRLSDGRIGTVMLATMGQETQQLGGTWYVDNILGFVAPPERANETGLALAHAIGSSRENPNWRSGEAEHQARMTARYREYLAWSSTQQQQAIESRWASDQAHQAGVRDILGGTVRLKDPVTGENFETGGQSRYYYRVVGQDRGMGTESDFTPAPDVDMRRLLRVGLETPEQ